jgi:hypothetical protein
MAEYEAKIAALDRKVGQLTMELDLVQKPCIPGPEPTTIRYRSSAASSLFYQAGALRKRDASHVRDDR